jgi:hypothetical protein
MSSWDEDCYLGLSYSETIATLEPRDTLPQCLSGRLLREAAVARKTVRLMLRGLGSREGKLWWTQRLMACPLQRSMCLIVCGLPWRLTAQFDQFPQPPPSCWGGSENAKSGRQKAGFSQLSPSSTELSFVFVPPLSNALKDMARPGRMPALGAQTRGPL